MLRYAVPLVAVVACFDEPRDPGLEVTSHVARKEIPLSPQGQLDLLFVVDTSPSMAPHREAMLANAGELVAVLNSLDGGVPDLHVGFVSADLGSRGSDDEAATTHGDCSADGGAGVLRAAHTVAGPFITDVRREDGIRELNYDGDLGAAVAASFDHLGTTACPFPRPLEAAVRAIENPANDGFVREQASLAIVFVTASDDCSFRTQGFLDGADPFTCVERAGELVGVEDFAQRLKAKKSDPTKVWVAGVLGPDEPFVGDPQTRTVAPSCTDEARSAQPGVRLQAFLDLFPNRTASASICNQDWSSATANLATLPRRTLGAPCFDPAPIDVDPVTPGDQFECEAWLRLPSGEERELPACDEDKPGGCWRFVAEPQTCPDEGLLIRFDHVLPTTEPAVAVIECVVQ